MTVKLRKCTFGGCPNTVMHDTNDHTPPRCDRHKNTYTPKKVYHDHQFFREKYFYGTAQWQKLRNRYINLHPLCEHCERRGLVVPAAEVDHIKEICDGGDKLSMDNLQSLCSQCHRIKTAEEKRKREARKNLNGFSSLSDF